LSAQVASYEPISKEKEAEIKALLAANKAKAFFEGGNINIGRFYIGPVLHFLHFNPIEKARIRLSGGLKLDNGLSFFAMGAYGTKDRAWKYDFAAAYRFKTSARSHNNIALSFTDNTYLPYLSDYDHLLNSTFEDADFFLFHRRRLRLSDKMSFDFNALRFDVEASFSRNRNSKYDPQKEKQGVKFIKANFYMPMLQLTLAKRDNTPKGDVIVSRYCDFPTMISVSAAREFFINDPGVDNRNRFTLNAQCRIPFDDYKAGCADIGIAAGYITKDVSRGGLYFPQSQTGYVSRSYAFLLIPYSRFATTKYLSPVISLNSGGMLLNNIPFFRRFHGNEFLNYKLYISPYKPYHEVSFGVDNVLDICGFELAWSSLNKWGVFLRLRVDF
jgi:hypothetical protein